ncbi:CBU_0592 family membrane protein [Sphingobium estronivorans]|uniref:CBU_0592 family membrane protein n=1 Tax=Sphingobium estronivorans TaxID=1577690 RepID=UPI00123B2643
MAILVEVAGWLGAMLVLGAYMLVSSGRLTGSSAIFQGMNALGSALFILNTGWHGAIPSMVLNIIWLCIGLFALWHIHRRGRTG